MIRIKSKTPYWEKFSVYQTFETVKEMNATVKHFLQIYTLTPATQAVLNTLKLYSKRYVGVCWLYREEIAKKAKVSLASVKRALKELKEIGILSIYPQIHTLKGGHTHNVYVINPTFELPFEPEFDPAESISEEAATPTAPSVSAISDESHKNSHTNSHTKFKDLSIERFDILKDVPNEFIDLLEPFYANSPKTIHARWRTVLSAAKKSCNGVKNAYFDSIRDAWKETIRQYKRGKIKKATDDGIGAYFYGVLCDYLLDDWIRANAIFT